MSLHAEPTRFRHVTRGFGVPDTPDPQHFKVILPRSDTGRVRISEHLGLQAGRTYGSVIDRVLLDYPRWTLIRAVMQYHFNERLLAHGLKPATWKAGENQVDRLLGKELCMLAWGVEHMEPDRIPIAIRNWLALRPEERWWLFNMVATIGGRANDAPEGWRLALRYALDGGG